MEDLNPTFRQISADNNADIFLFCAGIDNGSADELISDIRKIKIKKENCILILTTDGGDPDAGYRIARYIKQKYTKFILFVFGFCKSTGTLIALGADEIVIGDLGEFGPLDIQLSGGDELTGTSGLSYLQCLISLNERIYSSFEENFIALKSYGITTKTAAEIGSKLAIGIIEPIAAQIDPVKLGEVQRAIKIASFYGERMIKNNKDSESIQKLIGNYPSHTFVIDYEEMKGLFKNKVIRRPKDHELIIEEELSAIVRREGRRKIVTNIEFEEEKTTTNEEATPPTTNEVQDSVQPQ